VGRVERAEEEEEEVKGKDATAQKTVFLFLF
jgi:hypothetical protein